MEQYYILVRKIQINGDTGKIEGENCFKAISRIDAPYIGQPKYFSEIEMHEEYTKLSVKYGSANVKVGKVVYMRLEGKSCFVDGNASCPWAVAGKIDIIK